MRSYSRHQVLLFALLLCRSIIAGGAGGTAGGGLPAGTEFDTNGNTYTLKLSDINSSSNSCQPFRIIGQTNLDQTSTTDIGGDLWLEAGSNYGPGNTYNGSTYLGAYYEGGPNGDQGHYPFLYAGTLDGGGGLGVRIIDPDSLAGGYAVGSYTGGEYFEFYPYDGAGYAYLSTESGTLLKAGPHGGRSVLTLPALTVADNAFVFNVSANPQTPNTVLIGPGNVGTATCSQPFQGNSYSGHSGAKEVWCYLSGYSDTGTQTYTFLTAFDHAPGYFPAVGVTTTPVITPTTVTFTATLQTGTVILKGF